MLLKGPFNVTWNNNTLEQIESIVIEYDTNSEDYEANSGQVYQIEKSKRASIKLTFLATDIPSIAAVLPQHFVPEGSVMGDGGFVFDDRGAIDIKQDDCDTEFIYSDLEIFACADPSESFKLLHARTIVDGFEIGKIRKIVIKFIGEPEAGQSVFQLVGDPGESEFFQLDNDELFLLDDGNNLIL